MQTRLKGVSMGGGGGGGGGGGCDPWMINSVLD